MKKLFLAAIAVLLCTGAVAQTYVDVENTVAIDVAKGVDVKVDYRALVHFGPWDDRNYDLTAEDLALLSVDEASIHDPIPAFFRVFLRKNRPDLRDVGPAQYPRSALQMFRMHWGGYQVDGRHYYGARRVGDRYFVDFDDPAPSTESTDFVDGEVRITSPNGAAEAAIKIHPSDTNLVIAGSNGPGSGQKMHWSNDGGDTWAETTLPLGSTCCDPAVDWSSDGTYAYATTLGSCFIDCGIWVYRSDDNGQTWDGLSNVNGDPRREIGQGDKEFLHVDQSATSPFQDNVYVTWHQGNVLKVATSSDNAHTFTTFTHPSDSVNVGIGSDVTTDAAGNVYHFWPAFNSRTIRMSKSTNGGATWSAPSVVATTQGSFIFPLPSIETREAFIYVSADTDRTGGAFDGSIYAAWTDNTGPDSSTPSANHGRIQVGYSRDGGNTWNISTPHETADQNSVDRWHQWLAVGPDGTVYCAFYDTRSDGNRSTVDFYYSISTDGAVTWTTPERLTTAVSPNIADGFEFGDYNGLDVVMNDLITVFTDNRSEGGGAGDSIDIYGVGRNIGNPSVCGNGVIEPGEACEPGDLNGQTCSSQGCSGGTLACNATCTGFDLSACTGCPSCGNGTCEAGEDCNTCSSDCPGDPGGSASCGNGVCEAGDGETCFTCPEDCAGRPDSGPPSQRYCCGIDDGQTPNGCGDSRCTSGGFACTTTPVGGGTAYCCGDGTCEGAEDATNCAIDCAECSVSADCDDGDSCTTDVCTAGVCSNQPIDCSDGDACTADTCSGGVCSNPPLSCDDGDACTTDSCDSGTGCSNVPIDCDDLNACTIDTCSGGVCSSDPLDCDDGDACTIDSCDPGSGCVNQEPACQDGDGCCPTGCDETNDDDCITCQPVGGSCVVDGDCCGNKCRGPSGRRTCK